jgi:hypothetical protein
MRRLLASLFFALIIAIGCAPTQPFVPAFPMEKGRGEIRFSVGYSTCKTFPLSFQMGGWLFVTDRDAIGASATTFLIFPWPAVMSYAHYWPTSNDWMNAQIHKTILPCQNPLIEGDIGYARGSWNWDASSRLGLGVYKTRVGDSSQAGWRSKLTVMPIVGLQYRNEYFEAEEDMIYGYSKRAARYSVPWRPPAGRDSIGEFARGVIPRSSIVKIEAWSGEHGDSGWNVLLDSGKTIVISNFFPRAVCGTPLILSWVDNPFDGMYRAPEHEYWWISEITQRTVNPQWPKWSYRYQLDMKKVMEDYNAGGDLRLTEDSDLVEQTLKTVRSGFDDIFFQIGGLYYDKK